MLCWDIFGVSFSQRLFLPFFLFTLNYHFSSKKYRSLCVSYQDQFLLMYTDMGYVNIRFNGYSIKIFLVKTRNFLVRPVISWYWPGIRPHLPGVTSIFQNIETRNRNQKPGSLKLWDPGTETRYLIPGRYLVKAL